MARSGAVTSAVLVVVVLVLVVADTATAAAELQSPQQHRQTDPSPQQSIPKKQYSEDQDIPYVDQTSKSRQNGHQLFQRLQQQLQGSPQQLHRPPQQLPKSPKHNKPSQHQHEPPRTLTKSPQHQKSPQPHKATQQQQQPISSDSQSMSGSLILPPNMPSQQQQRPESPDHQSLSHSSILPLNKQSQQQQRHKSLDHHLLSRSPNLPDDSRFFISSDSESVIIGNLPMFAIGLYTLIVAGGIIASLFLQGGALRRTSPYGPSQEGDGEDAPSLEAVAEAVHQYIHNIRQAYRQYGGTKML